MPRRLANGLTLLSAVVCVGSLLLVGRSFVWADRAQIRTGLRFATGAIAIDGQLMLDHGRRSSRTPFYSSRITADVRPRRDEIWKDLRGVRAVGIGWGTFQSHRILILPLWLLPLLTAIAPVRWWRRHRREAGRGFAVERTGATAASPR